MEIDVLGELKAYSEVRSTNCTVCLRCTDECSKRAVAYTFRHPNPSMSPEAAVRAERLEVVAGVDAGDAGADDEHVDVFGHHAAPSRP